MKNIYDVLRQKEAELTQLQKEIEALRIAARLLSDESDNRAEAVGANVISAAPRPVPASNSAKDAGPNWQSSPRQFP